jgi:TolB-like protein
MLNNDIFRKAPRLSRLLSFLVDRWQQGAERDTTEYGIGIEVFDRDPAAYSTGEDPIVRVQVGRLREKLRAYYAGPGRNDGIVISIPIRSYMPVIQRRGDGSPDQPSGYMLAVHELRSVSTAPAGAPFAQGLSEELSYHLFRAFGDHVLFHQISAAAPDGADYRLEGSVRIEADLVRAAVRLTNAQSGVIVWSEQLDRTGAAGIPMQEDLARAICCALQAFFAA